ncbi:MAG: histidinol-phosphate transaminase [Campylobacteraceae bacterium]|nr:histidinol-phosphate transaminase [Campylobacteraceae bacterium]
MKFNQHLELIQNYEAGKPIELVVREFGIKPKDVIKLASNENPMGTSKLVSKALKNSANLAHLYPDDSMFELKGALASKYEVESKNIIIGAGSDQVIEFIMHALTNEKRGILTAGTTFSMYEIYAKHTNAKVFKTKSAEHSLKEIKEIYEENKDEISIIFLCLPNNPLGECLDAKAVYEFIKSVGEDVLVVIDAAYNEFAAYKDKNKKIEPNKIASEFKNAIYLGTFSKLYGLGGLRVGYGVANSKIISNLSKLRPPFNITNLSLKAAIEVLKDRDFREKTLENNAKEMERFEKFAKKNGLEFIPSYTNFITIFFKNSSEICAELLKKGIILRDLKGYGLNAIRITIGLPSQNKRVLGELKKLL